VSHDDHVDGLNHELGLLVALGLLGVLGETGGLGDGSSLGSEVSALSGGGSGHLLLVSGVLSEFGVMSLQGSSLLVSLSLEVGLSLLVSMSLLGFEGLHLLLMGETFGDGLALHVGVSDSLGMSSLSSSDGGHFLGVGSASLGEEHLLFLDESSFA
jgi:hypothetical protein